VDLGTVRGPSERDFHKLEQRLPFGCLWMVRFRPKADDNYLVSLGLDWLPEVAVIIAKWRAGTSSEDSAFTTLDRGLRAIRFGGAVRFH
jgi:hypothetical protein